MTFNMERQRLQPRHDGLPHAQHRSPCQRRCRLDRLLRSRSCTAGRATFITGQSPMRTGLLKFGCHRRVCWTRIRRFAIAEATRVYDRTSSPRTISGPQRVAYPTVHGFDEFFGNLYHLNAEDGRNTQYPQRRFQIEIRSARRPPLYSNDRRHPEDPQFGSGITELQGHFDTRSRRRRGTVNQVPRCHDQAVDRVDRDEPSSWFNPSRMHIWTRLGQLSRKGGCSRYSRRIVEHDGQFAAPEEARRPRHRQRHDRHLRVPTTAPRHSASA